MVETQTQLSPTMTSGKIERSANITIPGSSITLPQNSATRLRSQLALDTYSPVNQNGSFEFDRVIKSGYVQKRTKTKAWKSMYLVLRPNTLFVYKSEKEDKLRHKIYLTDLTAATLLKDPKNKRQHVFGLFSPARNFHFQAPTAQDAQQWIDLIRKDARIEEEEEEMFLASPVVRRDSYTGFGALCRKERQSDRERFASSSPEPQETAIPRFVPSARRPSQNLEYSGNELASHSDFSDSDIQRLQGASIESLAVQSPPSSSMEPRPSLGLRNASQVSGINIEQDPDRIIWQGWLWWLKSKGGVRQWKDCWAVLRPRNLILYKDESEYAALFIVHLGSILTVVDIDPISRSKTHCLQIITEEKSYRLCAHDEERLVQCLGAFKSLLAKRKELEAKAAAGAPAVV